MSRPPRARRGRPDLPRPEPGRRPRHDLRGRRRLRRVSPRPRRDRHASPHAVLAYCVMPNHFHLVLWPVGDGDLSRFMHRLTMTHTQRWHAHHPLGRDGPPLPGPVQVVSGPGRRPLPHPLPLRRVQRPPRRPGAQAEAWPVGSLWRSSPRPRPGRLVYRSAGGLGRASQRSPELPPRKRRLLRSLRRGQPLGTPDWQTDTAAPPGVGNHAPAARTPQKGRPRHYRLPTPFPDPRPALRLNSRRHAGVPRRPDSSAHADETDRWGTPVFLRRRNPQRNPPVTKSESPLGPGILWSSISPILYIRQGHFKKFPTDARRP